MLINYKEKPFALADIFRVIVSGASGVGKTHWVKQALQAKLFKFDRISYHHPDAGESLPVDWHETLSIVYKVGLPDEEYLRTLPPYSVVIIDDLYESVVKSYVIDLLIRVLSSKRKLHVFILTQQYFSRGPFSVSIRSSCNYHVLMPSNDYGSNRRVACQFNLKNEVQRADEYNADKLYPYVVIARDNIARSCRLQVFVDFFMRYKTVIIGCMVWILISKADLESCGLKFIDKQVAQYDANNAKSHATTAAAAAATAARSGDGSGDDTIGSADTAATTAATAASISDADAATANTIAASERERRRIERQVRRALQRHQKSNSFER